MELLIAAGCFVGGLLAIAAALIMGREFQAARELDDLDDETERDWI